MTVYEIGTILTLKKPHPCGSRQWKMLRPGWENRLECMGCGHILLMKSALLEKSVRKVERPEVESP